MSDEVLEVNLETLRIREIEEIEEIIGQAIDIAFADGNPRGKALRALGYIVKKRENPDFTLEDAGELVINVKAPPTDPIGAAG